MCFKFTQYPDPPFFFFFLANWPWAASFTEQSLLWGGINLIMFMSIEPPFLWHPYQISMTQFINHLKRVSSQLPCMSYTWVRHLFTAGGLLPRSIGTPLPCNRDPREPEGARNCQTAWVHLYFAFGCYGYQPENILLRWLRLGLFQMTSKGQRCHRILEEIASYTEERKWHSEMW